MLDSNKIISKIWNDIQKTEMAAISNAAKANPIKYKDCKVFPHGARMNWRYFRHTKKISGTQIDWCWSVEKNVAGHYLSWVELWNGKNGKRLAFKGWKKKKDAIDDARARSIDALKPRPDQKYTIPKW